MIITTSELESLARDESYQYLREQIESLRKYLYNHNIHTLEDLFESDNQNSVKEE